MARGNLTDGQRRGPVCERQRDKVTRERNSRGDRERGGPPSTSPPECAGRSTGLTNPNPCEEQRQTDDEPRYDVQDMDADEGRRQLPLVRREQVRAMGQSGGSGSRTRTRYCRRFSAGRTSPPQGQRNDDDPSDGRASTTPGSPSTDGPTLARRRVIAQQRHHGAVDADAAVRGERLAELDGDARKGDDPSRQVEPTNQHENNRDQGRR